MTDQQIIATIKDNSIKNCESAMNTIYSNYYNMIESFITQNSGTKEDAKDVFQDVVISLYNNVKQGKYRPDSKLSTYIFSICKNNWFKSLRKSGRISSLDSKTYQNIESDDNIEERIEYTEQQKLIGNLLHNVGHDCKKILKLFYFEKMRMVKIAVELGMSSEQVAKNQKSRCMKKLRSIVLTSNYYSKNLRNT